jgi:hypothetical protein
VHITWRTRQHWRDQRLWSMIRISEEIEDIDDFFYSVKDDDLHQIMACFSGKLLLPKRPFFALQRERFFGKPADSSTSPTNVFRLL